MTTATLKSLGEQGLHKVFLVEFQNCSIYDAFMFKNNVWNWLFTNTMDVFEISDDQNQGFLVRLVENRDAKKFINNFETITFEELQLV